MAGLKLKMEAWPTNTKHCPICNDDYAHLSDVLSITYSGMCTLCRTEQIEEEKEQSNVKVPKKSRKKFGKSVKKE